LGHFPSLLGGIGLLGQPLYQPGEFIRCDDNLRPLHPPKGTTTAYFGKVTPKPGYVYDRHHPDFVRLKTLSDYPPWAWPAVFWRVFWAWLEK